MSVGSEGEKPMDGKQMKGFMPKQNRIAYNIIGYIFLILFLFGIVTLLHDAIVANDKIALSGGLIFLTCFCTIIYAIVAITRMHLPPSVEALGHEKTAVTKRGIIKIIFIAIFAISFFFIVLMKFSGVEFIKYSWIAVAVGLLIIPLFILAFWKLNVAAFKMHEKWAIRLLRLFMLGGGLFAILNLLEVLLQRHR